MKATLDDSNDILQQYNDFSREQFNAMHSDFAKCAKENISPCFFCVNDEICNGIPEDCDFVWMPHN